MAKSRQAEYNRRRDLLALRGLAAGSAIDVSDVALPHGGAWRIFWRATGETIRTETRYQVAHAYIDGFTTGRTRWPDPVAKAETPDVNGQE